MVLSSQTRKDRKGVIHPFGNKAGLLLRRPPRGASA